MTTYQAIFNSAFSNYSAQKERPGFKKTIFSAWRHCAKMYTAVWMLAQRLQLAKTDEQAQNAIISHLRDPANKNNHHSFNSYLIDALLASDQRLDWAVFQTPQVKTYNGVLYRGMTRSPDIIFTQGLQCRVKAHTLADYLQRKNDRVGISTSKSFVTALAYALKRLKQLFSAPEKVYVYKINYRGGAGVDIINSNKLHQFWDALYNTEWKDEVNIAGDVTNTDIEGAYEITQTQGTSQPCWIANPHYVVDKAVTVMDGYALRQHVFVA